MRALLIVFFMLFSVSSFAADWSQWRGDGRSGVSSEVGLLKKWPAGGPELLWSVGSVGKGNSSISIAKGMVYVTGNIGKVEYLTAYDLKGNIKWQKPYGKAWDRSFSETRTTATIDGGRAYVITGMGVLSCLDAITGDLKWTCDVFAEYEGQNGFFGKAESPLIVDDKVICTPSGKKAAMIALDKITGEVVWSSKSTGDMPGYCSPLLVERGGKKIIVTVTGQFIIGVNSADGEILWKYACSNYQKKGKGNVINTNTPLYFDGGIYVTSGYNNGSVMLEISADGKSVQKAWINHDLDVHHGGVVLVDGYIYGANWHSNAMGNWLCVDWQTGKTMYDIEWHNKGQIIAADGMLYCYDEDKNGGNFGLVKASTKGFEVVSEFKIEKGEGVHWAHPAISDGVLYIRHENFLMAYDIKK